MGTYVSLVWDDGSKVDNENFESVFKWSSYPGDLDNELIDKHPELAKFGSNFDFNILKSFEKWLENLAFFVKYVSPSEWKKYCSWYTPEQALESIKDDLKWVKSAFYHAKQLETEGKNPRLSIG